MTEEEKAEAIDTFISIGEKNLKGNKHFHLEPILARDTIQAIKELEKENAELKKDKEWLDTVNNKQTEIIIKLNDKLSQINDICDYVLDGTTHWDEELEDFFKQLKKIL